MGIIFILKNKMELLMKLSNGFLFVQFLSLVSVLAKLEETTDCLIFVYGRALICSTKSTIIDFYHLIFMQIE